MLPAGQDEARLTITAPRDAAIGLIGPAIVGKAMIGSDQVVRTAEPTEEVMQAFSYKHLVPTREDAVAVP